MNGQKERESCLYTEVEERGHTGCIEPRNRHRGQQPVVWLPTPSVYFHITSIDRGEREREPVREMERGKMDVLMCLMLTPRPDMSS